MNGHIVDRWMIGWGGWEGVWGWRMDRWVWMIGWIGDGGMGGRVGE